MKIDWYEKNDSPYNIVENIIENWCSDHGYSDMMVLLRIDGEEEKVYLECNASGIWTWEYDWFEGGEIELLGFCPVNEVIIPEEYMLKDKEAFEGIRELENRDNDVAVDFREASESLERNLWYLR